MIKTGISLFAAALLLAACAGTDPNTSDFTYKPQKSSPQTDVTIAMLRPDFQLAADHRKVPGSDVKLAPFQNMAFQYQSEVRAQLEPSSASPAHFEKLYRGEFQAPLEKAVTRNTRAVLKAKGFHVARQYDHFSDMAKDQRDKDLLITVPSATIGISRKVDDRQCLGDRCTSHGKIALDGQLLVMLVEPTSGSPVAIIRRNIYSMDIAEPYVLETPSKAAGWWSQVKQSLGLERFKDTRKQALGKALTQLHHTTMAQIDGVLARRDVLAFNRKVKRLKGQQPAPQPE